MDGKKKRPKWVKKLNYQFDKYMSKGVGAQFVMLLIAAFIVVLFFGVAGSSFDNEETTAGGVWSSLMHLIDQGTITADGTANKPLLALMLVVTLCGMVLMGALIGIIGSALDRKMSDLRMGHSQIIEKDHTVIIGFDSNIFSILEELVEANANQPRGVVVVLDDVDKEEMEQAIREHFKGEGFRTTEIICRKGKPTQDSLFEMASLEMAKAVIVNNDNDFYVLRILLSVTSYLKQKRGTMKGRGPNITTLLHNKQSIEAAKIATEEFRSQTEILYFEDLLARIMAQVCRQPGLSLVLAEVFSYQKSELYFEAHYKDGSKFVCEDTLFGDLINRFENAVLVGVRRNGGKKEIMINPENDIVIHPEDDLILLSDDDGEVVAFDDSRPLPDESHLANLIPLEDRKELHVLVLDWNLALKDILRGLDDFVKKGSTVLIASDRDYDVSEVQPLLEYIDVAFIQCDIFDPEILSSLVNEKVPGITNVLLVCEDGIPEEEADAQTAMLLLHLRSLVEKFPGKINVTSEVTIAEDQQLLKIAKVNDFIVGSEIANRIMAQVSNELDLHVIFRELLQSEGSEIYMKPAGNYVKLGEPISFAAITKIVRNNAEVAMGWKLNAEDDVTLNPSKHEMVTFGEDDTLVILSLGEE